MPHTQTVYVATGELADEMKPLKESSGTGYIPGLSKLGGSVASYTLMNSMRNRKGQ